MSELDAAALEEALLRRVRLIVPEAVLVAGGIVAPLLESFALPREQDEAVQFCARRLLEEVQDEIILQLGGPWPTVGQWGSRGDALPVPYADLIEGRLQIGFEANGISLVLPPLPIAEVVL